MVDEIIRKTVKTPLPVCVEEMGSDDFNAFASRESDSKYYYIGINYLDYLHLLVAFRRLLAEPTFLPALGNSAAETQALPQFDLLGPSNAVLGSVIGAPLHPADMTRFHFAGLLREIATNFLIMHELSHILLGHVDYVIDKIHTNALMEVKAVSPAHFSAGERQAMEFDADAGAMYHVLENLLKQAKELQETNDYSHELSQFFKDPAVLSSAFFIAVYMVFRLFSGSRNQLSDLKSGSHPHPVVRQAYLTGLVNDVMSKFGLLDHKKFREQVNENIAEIERGISKVGGSTKVLDTWPMISDRSVINHVVWLEENLKRLKKKLNPLS